MAKYYLLVVVFLFKALLLRGCDRKYGCSSPSKVYGGKLRFTGNSGLYDVSPPSWIAGKRIIFLQEGLKGFPSGSSSSGRGRIRVGKRCLNHGVCQKSYTSSSLIQPCVKDRDSMCDEDLSLDLETKSTRRKVRLVAAWNITDKSSCKTTNKSLVIRQKDRDACTHSSDLLEPQQTIQIDTLSGVKDIKVTHPNSLYDVTLEVICGTGDTYKKTVQQRTDETGPTGTPQKLTKETTGTSVYFSWREPPCGERNGNIIAYDCAFKKDGQGYTREDRTTNTYKYYFDVESGGQYTFKVRAETTRGRGRYTQISFRV